MNRWQPEVVPCALCDRAFTRDTLSRHHCKPKSKGGTNDDIALICGQCHSTVHANYTNETLAALYPTAAKLRLAPELTGYFKWVRKQPTTRRIKNRPRKAKL
jgi:5-methylcytosine-specific restriction enzyme A